MNYKAIAAAILAFAMALSCGDFKAKTTEDAQRTESFQRWIHDTIVFRFSQWSECR